MKPITPLLLLSILLPACGVLKPVKDTSVQHLLDPAVAERTLSGNVPAIAIGRPALPSYLDRQQIVTRTGTGQLGMTGYHLWAEPLDSGIARVVATNLARLTGSLNIQPVGDFVSLDYTAMVEIRVAKFEAAESGPVVLECTWKVQPIHGSTAPTRSFRTEVPVAGQGMDARVAAMNEALARLSRTLAGAI